MALAVPVSSPGSDYVGSALVCLSRVEHNFLHNRIREQGGASGSWVRYPPTGIVTFLSYRDPKPANSLLVFGDAPAFLEAWAEETATKDGKETLLQAILPVISVLDQPLTTQEKGHVSLFRFIKKETAEDRKRFRDQVLNTDTVKINEFARKLKRALHGKALGGKASMGASKGAVTFVGPEMAAKTLVDAGMQLEITAVD